MNKEQKELIKKLASNNEDIYNLHKLGEECLELGLIITQFILKPDKVSFQEIIDEIGDVNIRINIIKEYFKLGTKDNFIRVKERIEDKLNKYQEYLDTNKYKNI